MSDQSLIRSLNALLTPDQRKKLSVIEPRGGLSGKRVSVGYKAPATGGGGIASPVTETQYSDRTSYEITTQSSDGLYTRVRRPVKSIRMLDANGEAVVLQFAEPEQ